MNLPCESEQKTNQEKGLSVYDGLTEYAQRLCDTLPEELDTCFFVNSGSEANELALRMAKTFTGQKDMIAVEVGYHGNSNACIDISSYKFDGKGGKGKPTSKQLKLLDEKRTKRESLLMKASSEKRESMKEIIKLFKQSTK